MTYAVTDWEPETDLGNDDDRKDVYFLTITEDDEEIAIVVHRTVGGQYPLDGYAAEAKKAKAFEIVRALNLVYSS